MAAFLLIGFAAVERFVIKLMTYEAILRWKRDLSVEIGDNDFYRYLSTDRIPVFKSNKNYFKWMFRVRTVWFLISIFRQIYENYIQNDCWRLNESESQVSQISYFSSIQAFFQNESNYCYLCTTLNIIAWKSVKNRSLMNRFWNMGWFLQLFRYSFPLF